MRCGRPGAIVYWLEEPFAPYDDTPSPQYGEFHRDPSDIWWIQSIEQTGDQRFRVELEGAILDLAFERTDGVTTFTVLATSPLPDPADA